MMAMMLGGVISMKLISHKEKHTVDHFFEGQDKKFNHMRAQNAIFRLFVAQCMVRGAEFKLIFYISRTFFDQSMTEVITHPNIEFYQDLHCHQYLTSCSLKGMLLCPLKILAYGMPYSAFVDYFKISIQFGIKLCKEFDHVIQSLYMKEYLWLPNEADLHTSINFVIMSMELTVCWVLT